MWAIIQKLRIKAVSAIGNSIDEGSGKGEVGMNEQRTMNK
jgi:hypothetical protein